VSAKNDANFLPAIRDRGVTVTGDQAALVIDIYGGGMRWVSKQGIDNGLVVVCDVNEDPVLAIHPEPVYWRDPPQKPAVLDKNEKRRPCLQASTGVWSLSYGVSRDRFR
jgi:hypothetical protein